MNDKKVEVDVESVWHRINMIAQTCYSPDFSLSDIHYGAENQCAYVVEQPVVYLFSWQLLVIVIKVFVFIWLKGLKNNGIY